MTDDVELAALQAGLVAALARAGSPEEVLVLLAELPLSESLRQWIVASDPRAIETAIELVQRWTEPLEPFLGANESSGAKSFQSDPGRAGVP